MQQHMNTWSEARWPAYLLDFVEQVLVECPRCGGCALVECKRSLRGTPRLSCPDCGLAKRGWPPPSNSEVRRCARRRCAYCNDWLSKAAIRLLARKRIVEILCPCGAVSLVPWPSASMRIGDSTDPYFGLPLWLRTEVRGERLWAYNRDHLAFLDAYVRAAHRQRSPNRNASLASRLPRWMKASAVRHQVLNAIGRLARGERSRRR